MLDSGVLLIVTARELPQDDLEIIKTIVNPDKIEIIWVGEDHSTNVSHDLKVSGKIDVNESMQKIKTQLQDKGIVFRP